MTQMHRRDFHKQVLLGTASLSLSPLAFGSENDQKKPNIILIMADDLGYECLSCNGSTSYQTPYLDQLAKTGIRFDHCYSQPLCTPSRVQIMTGRYNHRNYIGFGEFDPSETTFGNVLQKAGYATCISGKWQLAGTYEKPYKLGFDEYCLWQIQGRDQRYWQPRIVENGKLREDYMDRYGPDVYCDYILDFIQRKKDNPFFVYFPMCLTHDPFCPTPDSEGPKNEKRKSPKFFADMVHYMDKIVGRIVNKLNDLQLRENTLILFTGDNGTHRSITSQINGQTIQGGKSQMTDAGTHVPLIANWKGTAPSGIVNDDLIDFSDFLPTFAEASGAELPDVTIDGRSFLPQVRGEKGNPREWIFCHYWGRGREKEKTREYVRNQRWKLYDDGSFYDVKNDPLEKSPLNVEDLEKEIKQIRQKLQEAMHSLKE